MKHGISFQQIFILKNQTETIIGYEPLISNNKLILQNQ